MYLSPGTFVSPADVSRESMERATRYIYTLYISGSHTFLLFREPLAFSPVSRDENLATPEIPESRAENRADEFFHDTVLFIRDSRLSLVNISAGGGGGGRGCCTSTESVNIGTCPRCDSNDIETNTL